MDTAHASFAPDKMVMLIDPTDEASAGFWRAHNPEALAMAEGRHPGSLTGLLEVTWFILTVLWKHPHACRGHERAAFAMVHSSIICRDSWSYGTQV